VLPQNQASESSDAGIRPNVMNESSNYRVLNELDNSEFLDFEKIQQIAMKIVIG
jgi:hypothetical protein